MNPTLTYPPQPPRYYSGGYRYFFNGQEGDGEVYGSGGLAGYEFREYDTRLGRWWGIDQKAEKYPSLSPYQFCADSPIRMVDVDGSDFVVIIEKSGSENIITVKMNVYSASQEAYKQLLPAVAEINSITRKVTIDDVEYTLYFEISPVSPSNFEDPKLALKVAAEENYTGNFFEGTKIGKGPQKKEVDGKIGYVGGRTIGKSSWMYPGPDGIDFGKYYKLVGHELLHLLGLTDENDPEFYAQGGRMQYIASPYNNYEMYDISNDDIKNILRFAFLFNCGLHNSHRARVDYLDETEPIRPNPEIEVK